MSTPLEATEKYRGALGTRAWDQLSAQVDALTAAWQGPDLPPDLARFVPAEPKALRRLLLVELIKVDLEQRWLHFGLPKKVEEYVEEFPEIRDSAGFVPCDLIYEEFHIRSRTDEPAASQEFLQRFPDQRDQLKRLFDIQTNRTSSTVISGRRCPEIEIGQQIDDFDLLVRLGKGAFASVYLARQRSMQRLVALKGVERPRRRAADAGSARSPAHRPRVRSACRQWYGTSALIYAGGLGRHAAPIARHGSPNAGGRAHRQATVAIG